MGKQKAPCFTKQAKEKEMTTQKLIRRIQIINADIISCLRELRQTKSAAIRTRCTRKFITLNKHRANLKQVLETHYAKRT